jgi:acyl-coenzyme A thioesterase PaaI-like protein
LAGGAKAEHYQTMDFARSCDDATIQGPFRPTRRLLAPPSAAARRQAELVLRVMPMPADVNANGDIFGGWIMAQVDMAGAVLPARRARPHGHRGGQPVHLQAAGVAWATC